MKHNYFVAGTDTGVGKTLVTAALLEKANQQGLKTLGLKPVAAGCELEDGVMKNEDAKIIAETASVKLPYEQINTVALELAASPHIAAAKEGKRLSVERILGRCRGAMMNSYDLALIEGAGGWRVPLGPRETMADLAKAFGHDVILVVGLRLGCLNHALLTAETIYRDGLKIAGWVANEIDPNMGEIDENVATLGQLFPFPYLGRVPHLENADSSAAAEHLDISKLLDRE